MTLLLIVFKLLVLFQIKHFLADYPFQNGYMLKKFLPGKEFILPLASHAGVHAAMTLLIVFIYRLPELWWLALIDFCIHFSMDRLKASPNLLGRYKALSATEFKKTFDTYINAESDLVRDTAFMKIKHNTYFWWSLGLDQMVHHLTHYGIAFIMLVYLFQANI